MSERLEKLKASFQDEDDCISMMEMHELLVGSLDELQAADGKPRGSLNSAWVAQLMGWPEEYVAELTKACCEYWETVGNTKSRK